HTTLTATACEEYEWRGNVYTESGTYVHNYENELGCASSETLVLTINIIKYDIEYVLLDCKSRKYQFIPKNVGKTKGDKIEWNIDGRTFEEDSPEVEMPEGEHKIKLIVTSVAGCTKEFESTLSVTEYFDQYTIETTPQVVSKSHPTIRLYTEYRPNVSYEWDFGDNAYGFDNDVIHTYQINQEQFYDVYLTVTDENNCVEERKIRILVDNTIAPPNVFTPNSDGYNDLFMSGWHIKIFDRKGVLLYEGDKGWDGTYLNKMVPNDTYFYILTDNGVTKKGFITIIR
ncbi:MAG: gliding motility-associated C-terminal domain-containing protein, partial [Paludibacteraceae bacterium]|nr:gliding motility-associated C-terminal domain-containing protein [Paludibacteraceae bacterium]